MFTGVESYDVVLLLLGCAGLGAAVLPRLISGRPVSFPMLYLAGGITVFSLPIGVGPWHPLDHPAVAEHLTELGVIVALMGLGLKIDRPFDWRRWSPTWRLLAFTMPLTIAATAALGHWTLGLAPSGAVLLGAVVAPTDPVLAADVQSGRPGGEKEGSVRFALSSEAGLNDGLAFPFTNAAVAMAVAGAAPQGWIVEWLAVAVVVKIAVGVLVGWAFGKALAFLVFELTTGDTPLATVSEGMLALAATLASYSAAELLQGYGFLAVFLTALTIREWEREHEYHRELHDFAEQTERLLMTVILVLLGGAIPAGLFAPLTLPMLGVGLALVLVVRPVAGLIGLWGEDELVPLERGLVAFFGIRGIGSLYYLAHGLGVEEASFAQEGELWALVGVVVVFSVVIHGLTATPATEAVERGEASAGEAV